MFPLFLRLPERKVLGPNGLYIRMSQTKIENVYQSVGDFGIQASAAYTSICRELEYSLKILYYPNVAGFLVSETILMDRSTILLYVLKKLILLRFLTIFIHIYV